MNPERAALLGALLQEMFREDDHGKGLRIPDEVWGQFQRIACLPYNDIVVTRERGGLTEFLLTRREEDDPHWPGRPWHIPGSLWRPWRIDEDIDRMRIIPITQREACRMAAPPEIGVEVELIEEVMTHFWTDHPYGYPISHVCLCRPRGEIVETETHKFFPLVGLPSPMVPHHADFLKRCLEHIVAKKVGDRRLAVCS